MEKEQNNKTIKHETDNYIFCATVTEGSFKTKPYKASDINAIQAFIEANASRDTYNTYNEFKEPTTNSLDNIALLKSIVIDLDYALQGGFTLDQAKALIEMIKPQFNHDIPTPYRAVYSGGGVHLYFELEPSTDIAKYDLVNRGIFKAIDKCIGEVEPLAQVIKADHRAIGAYRYIRAIGTSNTKEHTKTTGIYASAIKYSLDELIENFIPNLTEITKGEINALQYASNKAYKQFKQYRADFTAISWRYAAIDDLKALQNARKELMRLDNKYYYGNKGNRNNMLFLYGLLAKWAFNDSAAVLDSMRAFNQFYGQEVLDDKEVLATYKSIMAHGYRTPRASTIINTLDIKPQEQELLKVLIGKEEVKRRKNSIRRSKRAIQAHSKALDKQAIMTRVIELNAQGLSCRAIAHTLKISHMTVSRYLRTSK
jgi:hypothetical protein